VLQYWGLQYTSATNGSILNSLTPIFIIALGAAFAARSVSPRRGGRRDCVAGGRNGDHYAPGFRSCWNISVQPGGLADYRLARHAGGVTLVLRWRPKGLDALSFLACFALVAEVPVGIAYAANMLRDIVWF